MRAPLSMDRTLLRISPHIDVTGDDLDQLAAALAACTYRSVTGT